MSKVDVLFGSFCVLAALVVFYLLAMLPFALIAEKACNDAGYPHSVTNYDFSSHCFKIVNQTLYIIPVSELEEK